MELPFESAIIATRKIEREFTYKNTVMLTLEIIYPEIKTSNIAAQRRINARYRTQAMRFYNYAASILYRNAVRLYRDSIANGFPFHPYDAVMNYEVGMNQDCHLSSFYDRYQYTGGAHGNTVRASDTFDLETGRVIPLQRLCVPYKYCRSLLIEQILRQADENIKENPGIYFEDYRTLIIKYFNPQSYFFTPEGISVYYQQYEIAPYATGIVVFNISYEALGIPAPDCKWMAV